MGSWNITCSVSNHSIKSGEPVRLIVLKKNDDTARTLPRNSQVTTSFYYPFTFAIAGKYNDYGSMEDAKDTKLNNLIHSYLKTDLTIDLEMDEMIDAIERSTMRDSDYEILNERNFAMFWMTERVWRMTQRKGRANKELNDRLNQTLFPLLTNIDNNIVQIKTELMNLSISEFNVDMIKKSIADLGLLKTKEAMLSVIYVNEALKNLNKHWMYGCGSGGQDGGGISQLYLNHYRSDKLDIEGDRACCISQIKIKNDEFAYCLVATGREKWMIKHRLEPENSSCYTNGILSLDLLPFKSYRESPDRIQILDDEDQLGHTLGRAFYFKENNMLFLNPEIINDPDKTILWVKADLYDNLKDIQKKIKVNEWNTKYRNNHIEKKEKFIETIKKIQEDLINNPDEKIDWLHLHEANEMFDKHGDSGFTVRLSAETIPTLKPAEFIESYYNAKRIILFLSYLRSLIIEPSFSMRVRDNSYFVEINDITKKFMKAHTHLKDDDYNY